MTERFTQTARRLRRFGVVAAIAVAGVLPMALAAGPAAATQRHPQNGCVSFKYTRAVCYLSLSTSITTPGSTITVYGAGYKAYSTVWLSLDPSWQTSYAHKANYRHNFSLASVVTNGKGDFTKWVTIPGSAPLGGATIAGDGTNPVGGSLDQYAHLLIVHPKTTGPVATTTTVSESKSWASYGHENKVTFSVDVTPKSGPAPSGDAVTIDIGSASCIVTLVAGKGSCTITATALPVGSGYAVTAAFLGAPGYAPSASTNTVVFAVTKEYQFISFGWLYGKTLSQSPITVSATASSGLPVSFTTTTPRVCTASGTNGATITLLAPGKCIVVASQAGDATYASAAPVAEYFTIPSSYHYHHHRR